MTSYKCNNNQVHSNSTKANFTWHDLDKPFTSVSKELYDKSSDLKTFVDVRQPVNTSSSKMKFMELYDIPTSVL